MCGDPLQTKPPPKNISHGVGYDGTTLQKKYNCDEPSCDRGYFTRRDLANHKRGAHGADRLKCHDSNCSASFLNHSAFYGHMWLQHDIGKGPKCDQCGKKAASVQNLENHQRSDHGAPKLQCKKPGCNKVYAYHSDMYKHMRKEHR